MTKTTKTLTPGSTVILGLLLAGAAAAANPPLTVEVLGKLHASNQNQIEAGKLAKKHGTSKAVKDFGDMLIKDHGDADKQVAALAKTEKLDLAGATPAKADTMALVPAGAAFDAKFAKMMVEDHAKEIAAAAAARDATTDAKLKELLTKLLPTLQKHQETAQKIVDGAKP